MEGMDSPRERRSPRLGEAVHGRISPTGTGTHCAHLGLTRALGAYDCEIRMSKEYFFYSHFLVDFRPGRAIMRACNRPNQTTFSPSAAPTSLAGCRAWRWA